MTNPGSDQKAPLPKHWAWWAFAWGLAEATFFFIVPDVFITRLALQNFRSALAACLLALAGALIGGTVLWWVSDYDTAPRLLHACFYLPGISRDLVADTGLALHARGMDALYSGMLRGQPYKLFAIHAGAQGVPFAVFLSVSAAARLGRFFLGALLAWCLGRALGNFPLRMRLQLHALAWLGFYLIYFLAMR